MKFDDSQCRGRSSTWINLSSLLGHMAFVTPGTQNRLHVSLNASKPSFNFSEHFYYFVDIHAISNLYVIVQYKMK